jgi:hypothetical protein
MTTIKSRAITKSKKVEMVSIVWNGHQVSIAWSPMTEKVGDRGESST